MEICLVCRKKQRFIFSYQNFLYYRCGNCQLVSTYPLPTTKTIKNYYENKFKKENYELSNKYSKRHKLVYTKYVKILKARLRDKNQMLEGKKVLDVGCFTGEFLETLQKENADVYGLELQDTAARIANNKLPGKVLKKDVMNYNFPQKKYDVITLLGVVEHVANPMKLLRKSFQLLKKGGTLMIQTPNSSSFLARTMGKSWPPYSPIEHIHIFSRKSLNHALKKCGFQSISFKADWKKLPVWYVYNNFNYFGPQFHRILKPLHILLNKSRIVLPFYIGEMIVTATKK